jgi:hypothetical protein
MLRVNVISRRVAAPLRRQFSTEKPNFRRTNQANNAEYKERFSFAKKLSAGLLIAGSAGYMYLLMDAAQKSFGYMTSEEVKSQKRRHNHNDDQHKKKHLKDTHKRA